MEPHGQNLISNVIAIIPARYASVRLPGKLLLEIDGKPLILHTLEQAAKAASVSRVIVATDNQEMYNVVRAAGGEAVMTRGDHKSGTDRVAEVAESLPEGSLIINVQGDEPLISPETIDGAVKAMLLKSEQRAGESDRGIPDIVTTCEPITSLHGELLNFNVVKVVLGGDRRALYFSRSPMPFPRDASLRYDGDPNRALESEPELFSNFRKHTGLYVYTREYLLRFAKLPQTSLEKFEQLEQLRALEDGARIHVVEAARPSVGVDTLDDYLRVKDLIECGIDFRRATRSDIPDVARVHVASWQGSFADIAPRDFLNEMTVEARIEKFRERACDEPYTMLVAEHPSEGIIGFADFGNPVLDVGFDAQIFSFYFLPGFQRKGLGERLFRRCVAKMKEEGIETLCLDALEASPYRTFYEKMGGRIVARDGHNLDKTYFETVIYGWDDLKAL